MRRPADRETTLNDDVHEREPLPDHQEEPASNTDATAIVDEAVIGAAGTWEDSDRDTPTVEVPATTPTSEVPAVAAGAYVRGDAAAWGQSSPAVYSAPHYPYPPPPPPPYGSSPYPFGPPPYRGEVPRRTTHIGPIAALLAVIALVVAAGVGASAEYALNHDNGAGSATFTPSPAPPNGGSATGPSSAAVSAIATQVDPAVVDIDTTLAQGGGAAGTGIVLTPSGLVLTNNHVIENATTINAQVGGAGRIYDATVLGYSISDDVALVQLRGASGLKTVDTASETSPAVGQRVVCIGNALGTGGTPAAVGGTITALDQTITAGSPGTASETLHGLIQMDAPIQSGDSGGPVVDSAARVIGMDTAASVNNGFGDQSGGQAYAIPLGTAMTLADQIKSGQASGNVHIGPRALLGVEVSDGGSNGGALVQQVEAGSPAASAGISDGDTIVSLSGAAVSSASDLSNVLVGHKPGDQVAVKWVDSSGATHSATVHLTAGPPA